jgi:hypothetical protein
MVLVAAHHGFDLCSKSVLASHRALTSFDRLQFPILDLEGQATGLPLNGAR